MITSGYGWVEMNKRHATEILAENLKALMVHNNLSAPELQDKSGVGRSTINNIKNCSYSASAETIQKLAAFFRLPAWALFVPGLDVTLKGDDLVNLITRFLGADDGGRDAVLRFALSESRQDQ